jgi:hypothetical protein
VAPDRFEPRPPHRPAYESPEVANRPPVSSTDPFFWKERYTLGAKRTADEESIRGVVVVVGWIVVTIVAFVTFLVVLIALANPTRSAADTVAEALILIGSAAIFLHLLTLGSAACQTVLRERQRQTLDSLLTMPVPRRAVLWPKWRVSFGRGWWWGGPGIAAVVIGLLFSQVAAVAAPGAVYYPAVAAFAVSFGVWLSIRSRTTARAIMWFMSAAGVLLLLPIAAWWWFNEDETVWAVGFVAAGAFAALAGAVVFWQRACIDFDAYGRE